MYDCMLDEANLYQQRVAEPPSRKRKIELSHPGPSEPPSLVYVNPVPLPEPIPQVYVDSDDDEVDPVAEAKYHRQVRESGGFDVDLFIQTFGGITPMGCSEYHVMFGKVGLHCYNIENGKNLEFKSVKKATVKMSCLFNFYITLEALNPEDNSIVTFQTSVTDAVLKHKASLRLYTNICRVKPLLPGTKTDGGWYPDDSKDDYYTGDLPDWLEDGTITESNELEFYEVKESELQDNKWLYLYAEFALFSKLEDDLTAYLPFEMKRVVVQTREDVEASMKLNSSNAILHLSFKTGNDLECRGIVRKTRDGKPGHIFLEARCWIDK